MDLSIGIKPVGGGVVTPLPPQQLQHILYTIQQIHTHTLNTITQLLTSHHQQHLAPTPTVYALRARLLVLVLPLVWT